MSKPIDIPQPDKKTIPKERITKVRDINTETEKEFLKQVEALYLQDRISIPLNEQSETLFHIAARRGFYNALSFLHSLPHNNFARLNANYETPAFIAAENGHLMCFALLLNLNPNSLTRPNKDGKTPAFIASENGHINCLIDIWERLLSFQEDLVKLKESKATLTRKYNHIEVTLDALRKEIYLPSGSTEDFKEIMGEIEPENDDEFESESEEEEQEEKIKIHYSNILEDYNRNVKELKDIEKEIETLEEKIELTNKRIEIINPNQPNNDGITAFQAAAANGHVRCLKYFDEELLNLQEKLRMIGNSKFIYAKELEVFKEKEKSINKLIVRINPDQLSRDGSSAVHFAAANGHLKCLEYLIETTDRNLHQQNNNGETAVSMAAKNGHVECLKYLLPRMATFSTKQIERVDRNPRLFQTLLPKSSEIRKLINHLAAIAKENHQTECFQYLSAIGAKINQTHNVNKGAEDTEITSDVVSLSPSTSTTSPSVNNLSSKNKTDGCIIS